MNWHEFFFSEKKAYRLRRHAIFWMLWWAYFTITYYYYLQVGLQKTVWGELNLVTLAESLILVLIHLATCYFFINVLLPGYLIKKKYFQFTAGILLCALFLLTVGYFIHTLFIPSFDPGYYSKISSNNTLWWTNINSGLLSAPKVIGVAAAIKLIKRWYLKQKEKEEIEQEKLITDLQLMKAQIRPDFLFNSLDQIFEAAQINSPQAPELLLKLADLLSYLLYECEDQKVPLEKELVIMKEYVLLEKARFGSELELEIVIKGNTKNKTIAPLLLLPFIENSFKHCNRTEEQPWINLEISIDNNILSMKLLNGVAVMEITTSPNEIKNIEKRLQLLYPGRHEIKKYVENEIYVVLLKVNLDESTQLNNGIIKALEFEKPHAYN